MSTADPFEPGYVNLAVLPLIIPKVDRIQGTWRELSKPQDEIIAFLTRLGIGGIKRRLVAKTLSLFEIRRLWPANPDFTKEEEGAPDSPHSDTEATTEPSSPVRIEESKSRWYQKQNFPMGRFAEGEISTGAGPEVDIIDNETGSWKCLAKIQGHAMIQRRFSAALNVTIYETRALVRNKFDIDSEGNLQLLDDGKQYPEESLMYFQWVLIDHNADDKKSVCSLFLEREE